MLAGLWQIPLALAGVGVMASGMLHIASANRPLTFEEQIQLSLRLRDAGRYVDAADYLTHLVNLPQRTNPERALLHMSLAQTIHQAELPLHSHVPKNVASIISNFERATRLGRKPSRGDWVLASDAYDWDGRETDAVAALRRAIELDAPRSSELRRRIVEIGARQAGELSESAILELDAILADEATSAEVYAWAVGRKSEILLNAGRAGDCSLLIAAARRRLLGPKYEDQLEFFEARVSIEKHELDDAERRLLAIRARRETRDELWADAGRLLGTIALSEDDPREALAFFEDVLQSYDRGDLRDACAFGRAQCLVRMEQHEAALTVFSDLYHRVGELKRHRYLSHAMIRTTLAVAGTTLCDLPERTEAGLESGVRYLRQALDWFPEGDRRGQLPLWSRVSESLRWLASTADRPEARKRDPNRAARLHEEAAEAYIKMSRAQIDDEPASAKSVWNAVQEYAAAGRRDRVIALLERFVEERNGNPLRSAALHDLGAAYHAEGRFAEAAVAYERVISEYLPLPAALASMVPLAQCLIQQGEPWSKRGVTILTDIVDDRGPAPLFTPQAQEYREALFQLARYYLQADDKAVPGRLELAIERLETARSLYPDDDRISELEFHLADSYRLSAMALSRRSESGDVVAGRPATATVPEPIRQDADRRMGSALQNYQAVIDDLAPRDESGLRDVERVYLKLSYLYRGDCLFDLGHYAEAREAYEEAAWRYADSPACVSASMQIYHCHLRMGMVDEARATLGRLKWLIATVPDKSFADEPGQPGKAYWTEMIARLERLDVADLQ